mmetsp:Transcript_6628/g.15271  ORF Transcript_6628/g.15271 Transcript_6628/m.15271 type:complete len:312 (-) Transcript_6628:346-1281(-)
MGAVCVTSGGPKGEEGEDFAKVDGDGHGKGRKSKGSGKKAIDEPDSDTGRGEKPEVTPSDQLHIDISSEHGGGDKKKDGKGHRLPPAADAQDQAAEHRAFLQEEGRSATSRTTRKGKRRGSMNREKPSVWGASERAAYEAEQGIEPESLTSRLGNRFGAFVGAGGKRDEVVTAQQKQLCSGCAQWLPDDCTCGSAVEDEKWISSDSEEDEEEAKHLTVKQREKLRKKKKEKDALSMSRGGTKVKAQRSIQEIRAQAQEREYAAALLYNKSSAAANALGTPAGPKVAVNPNPRLVDAMEKKKKKASQQGGGG